MERLWNANYNKVMFTNFTLFFSLYLITPLLPIYLSETFHASKDMTGLVLSGYTLTALIIRMFSGYIVDRFKRKTVLLWCLFIYFIFFSGYILAGTLIAFALVRTLHGGPFGASTVSNATMAIDVLPPSRRNEGIGFYGISNNLASAIAPMVGLFVYTETHNFQLLFWIALIAAALGYLSSFSIHVPVDAQIRIPTDNAPQKHSILSRLFLLNGWFIAINICLFGFCWGVMSNYLAIYGKENLNITSGTGTWFLILSIGLIVSRFIGSKSLRQGKLKKNALEGVVLSTLGYVMFVLWPMIHADSLLIGYYLSAVLIGLGNGHIWPAFQNMIINLANSNERGTANSTLLLSWDLGMGLGIMIGGVIAEYFGYNTTFIIMAAIHVAAYVFFSSVTKRKFR